MNTREQPVIGATHRSVQPNAALREQHTDTRAKEEESNETHSAPRRPTTPLPTAELFELAFDEKLGGTRSDRAAR